MTDDQLNDLLVKSDAAKAVREREAAAAESQRQVLAGKRDGLGNPLRKLRPVKPKAPPKTRSAVVPAEAAAMYRAGSTPREIAAHFATTPSSVYRCLRKAGISTAPVPSVSNVELARRYESGMTVSEVAASVGLTRSGVGARLRLAGVEMRPTGVAGRVAA